MYIFWSYASGNCIYSKGRVQQGCISQNRKQWWCLAFLFYLFQWWTF